jgi:hypothetical protein
VDPVPDHCYSENLVAPGIEPGTSGSAARNSDHQTMEAVRVFIPQSLISHAQELRSKQAYTSCHSYDSSCLRVIVENGGCLSLSNYEGRDKGYRSQFHCIITKFDSVEWRITNLISKMFQLNSDLFGNIATEEISTQIRSTRQNKHLTM